VSFRTILIIVNLVAVAALIGFVLYRVVSLRRNPTHRQPENLTPFYDDDVMEGAHLERALGVALVALVVILIGMVVYFMREPFRSHEATGFFKEQSIERGATLFAAPQSDAFSSTVSLQCARCHGLDGSGGVAPNVIIKSTDPRCDPTAKVDEKLATDQPYCLPKQVGWAAPNLQLAALRYSRAQLTQVITFGRPGTPMPAWGVLSGVGALNSQSIKDLVNYVESLSTTSDKAKALADSDVTNKDGTGLADVLSSPTTVAAADKWVAEETAAAAEAQDSLTATPLTDADARQTAQAYVDYTQQNLQVATEWRATVANSSQGQLLFMTNCARCHTRGWSYFDPANPDNTVQGLMAGGAYGPNLRQGDVNEQFPAPDGEAKLFSWIADGVPQYQAYGSRGISSGRMPHFGAVLTTSQICQIMAYERNADTPPLTTVNDTECVAPSS
jgi:mono/diheme cytochrome c family protein